MRELKTSELSFVSGAGDGCTSNNIGGVTNSGNFGLDLINIYEGAVQATSYMIERVARAWKSE